MKTDLIYMTNDEPFDTLKAQILVRIAAVYAPDKLNFDDYNVSFTVPRLVKDAIGLDAQSYTHLLKNAQKMDDPAVKILIDPKPDRLPTNPDKENEQHISKQGGKAKKASTQVPREDRILPANAALNEKIGILRARWACPNPGGPCGSDFCFVKPDGEGHFPLSHEHFNVWGVSWLKGSNFADENKPPNDKLFDGISTDSLGARSPLLQRRLELQNQRNAPPAPSMPQITINLPDMMRQQFQPPPPLPLQPALPALTHESVPMLVPHPLVPGPKLDINVFCQNYNLDPEIAARFLEHKYRTTDSFRYIEVKELKELGFAAGEIAELRAAIAAWAT
ncbi:hypothetical protein C8F04DRAFT_1400862 [Mycena alexandri]|uniref:Uncharacterized protein n=1 Tax=Mycena alexandri TaxID=1745969 RepID=A0AAD6WTQ4_9AGAR|nr:hypothetical protein C8F04DRAFT_1400862 [Mycena alexandri]